MLVLEHVTVHVSGAREDGFVPLGRRTVARLDLKHLPGDTKYWLDLDQTNLSDRLDKQIPALDCTYLCSLVDDCACLCWERGY